MLSGDSKIDESNANTDREQPLELNSALSGVIFPKAITKMVSTIILYQK
jgi:hypothetical protein